MPDDSTVTEWVLPWGRTKEPSCERWHLAVAWSLEEPARIAETAVISGTGVLGRGEPRRDDPAPRLSFGRCRPGRVSPQPPLAGARISRVQLVFTEEGAGALKVENHGRCPLLVNGRLTDEARVAPGAVLTLQNSLVVLAVRRRVPMDALLSYPASHAFAFGGEDLHGLVGESPAMWSLRDTLSSVARSGHHALIYGPSGSGKELAARALHELSARGSRPMVSRNAATLPESLMDAELFGNVRNYPNPGMAARPGLVGEADGSSLFLDEVGELPIQLQAHLLRLLDRDGEYQTLGDARPRRADVRLIGATNRPPAALKADFLARFTARVTVPSLAERREDIPLLIRHLVETNAAVDPTLRQRFYDPRPGFGPRLSPSLVERLVSHEYSLEVRELERLLVLAARTSRGAFIEATSDFMDALQQGSPEETIPNEGAPLGESPGPEPTREDVERALLAAGGNVSQAARLLGVRNRYVLYRLMKRFGITEGQERLPK